MKYKSKDLFQDWYSKGLKKDILAEELDLRKASIVKILAVEEEAYWFDLLNIFLGIGQQNKITYDAFVETFRQDDDNFPLIDNSNLVRVLIGCSIMQRIEVNNDYLSDALALALISSGFLNRINESPLPQIFAQAKLFWNEECESVRAFKQPKVRLVDGQPEPTMKDVYANFEKMHKNYTVLSEETNILWWVVGSYSNLLKEPFNVIGFPMICLVAPKELIDLTQTLPGIGRVDNLFNKIFDNTSSSAPAELKFSEYIQSVNAKKDIMEILTVGIDDLIDYCPVLYAISCLKDHGLDTWTNIFKKRGMVKEDMDVSPKLFAKQLYNELLLVKAYDNI